MKKKCFIILAIILHLFKLSSSLINFINTTQPSPVGPLVVSALMLNNFMMSIWHDDNTLRFYDYLVIYNGTTVDFKPLILPFYPVTTQMSLFSNRKSMNRFIANKDNLICVYHYPSLSECYTVPNVSSFTSIEFFNHSSFLIGSHPLNGYMIIDTTFNISQRVFLNNVSCLQKINDFFYDETKKELYGITESAKIGIFDLNPLSTTFLQMKLLPITLPSAGYMIFTLNYNSSIVAISANNIVSIYDSSILMGSYPLRKCFTLVPKIISVKQVLDTFFLVFDNQSLTQFDEMFFGVIENRIMTFNPMYIVTDIIQSFRNIPGSYMYTYSIGGQYLTIRNMTGRDYCLRINSNCSICNLTYKSNKCLQCKDQFPLRINGYCSCSPSQFTNGQCSCPNSGQLLFNTTANEYICANCFDVNCQICNTTDECLKCKDNYFLNNDICIKMYIQKLTILGNVLSFPNLRQIMRPTKIIFMVLDDYQYYNHHNTSYHYSLICVFQSIEFVQDLSLYPHLKMIEEVKDQINISKLAPVNYSNQTPAKYQQNTQKDINFLKSTWQMYEMQYIPSILTFMICRMLYIMLIKFKKGWFTGFLRRFFWGKRLFKVLFVTFIESNISYIGFHFGMQFIVPSYYESFGKLSILVATLFFFAALLYSLSFYLLLRFTCHPVEREFFLTFTRNNFQGYLGESLVGNIRNLLNGFIHSYFIYNYRLQISLLLLLKLLVLSVLFFLKNIYKKTIYDFLIKFYFIFGLLLDLILLLEYTEQIDDKKWEVGEWICLIGMLISTILIFIISIYDDLKQSIVLLWSKLSWNKIEPQRQPPSKTIASYMKTFLQHRRTRYLFLNTINENKAKAEFPLLSEEYNLVSILNNKKLINKHYQKFKAKRQQTDKDKKTKLIKVQILNLPSNEVRETKKETENTYYRPQRQQKKKNVENKNDSLKINDISQYDNRSKTHQKRQLASYGNSKMTLQKGDPYIKQMKEQPKRYFDLTPYKLKKKQIEKGNSEIKKEQPQMFYNLIKLECKRKQITKQKQEKAQMKQQQLPNVFQFNEQ